MQVVRVHEYGGPEALRLDELPTPEPGRGQARVKVAAAGVNFIDIYHRSGQYQVPLPYPLGREGAGTVEAVGDGAELNLGDRVAWAGVQGSYATHVLAPASELVPVPDGVDLHQAAAAMLQGMTAHYLTHSTYPLGPSTTCLIHAAAGGVGQLFCQMARFRGAGLVIGTAGTPEKAEMARQAGAHEAIVYTQQDFPAEARRLTDGVGVDVVYDSVGKDTFDKSLSSLRPRGMLVLFGASSGPVPPFDINVLQHRGSLYVTRPTLANYTASRDELLSRAGDVFGWLGQGKLKLRIEHTFPLTEAGAAQAELASRRTSGKLLLAV
ncbi:MAG: quinone oxidoreductase [Chloroflexota bacterium]|nr:quinone oxidoreductase [Chloroflexota bacterium]